MDERQAVRVLAALAQDTRLAIYRLLVERGPEGYSAGEIAERLRLANATLSFHLKAMTHARLLLARHQGRHIYYAPDYGRMNELVGFLTENCCAAADSDVACALAAKP